jgi:nicotinamidase-related amidase
MNAMGIMSNTLLRAFSASETARRQLRADECALLVIDVQVKMLPPIQDGERLLRNVQLLLRLAKILEIPVLATTQYAQGLGAVAPEIASLLAGSIPCDKLEFGCFSNQPFNNALRSVAAGRNTLLLCGMETHICVMQTALGALQQGYLVHVASDAVGSRSEWNWQVGLGRMQAAGALLSSTEMMTYELLHASGTDAFEQMLPYLKG